MAMTFALANAQDPKPFFELNTPETTTKNYVAREYVQLKPGFSFTAGSGKTFSAKTDPCLLFPPTQSTYMLADGTVAETVPEGQQGYVVGSIPGQFAVGPTGAATYTIPIEVPAGINGMQPNISLVYNSQGGNGIAGWGWNIGGLSAITRTKSQTYFDGVEAPLTWDKNSPLSLDGQRLLKIGEGADTVEYRTEIETFSRIVGYGMQDWGPTYFKVYTKNGLTLTFGSAQVLPSYGLAYKDARADGASSSNYSRLTWNLVRIEDNNGNYMSFNYSNVIGANVGNVVNEILYGLNDKQNTPHPIKIKFNYEKRTDEIWGFMGGLELLQQLRLDNIQTWVGNNLVTTYDLTYQENEISRLNSVDVLKDNSKVLPPICLFYGEPDVVKTSTDISFITKDTNNKTKDKVGLMAYDIDGDGVAELCDTYIETPASISYLFLDIHYKKNNWVANEHFAIGMNYNDVFKVTKNLFGDFNGNGSVDVAFVLEQGFKELTVMDKKDDKELLVCSLEGGGSNPFLAVGNYRGKNLSDLVVIYNSPVAVTGGYQYTYNMVVGLYDGTVIKAPNDYTFVVPKKINSVKPYNPTGLSFRDDLWLDLADGSNIILKNTQTEGYNTFTGSSNVKVLPFNIGKDDALTFGDVNHDGLTDVVYRKNTNDWYVAYSKGDYSFKTEVLPITCEKYDKSGFLIYNDYDENDRIELVDLNGDGLIDIVTGDEILSFKSINPRFPKSGDFSFKNTRWRIYMNSPSGYVLTLDEISTAKSVYSCFADFYGNGNVSWAHADNTGKVLLTDFGHRLNDNILTKITIPSQTDKVIAYKPLSDCKEYDHLVSADKYFNDLGDFMALRFQPFRHSMLYVVSDYSDANSTVSYHYGLALYNAPLRGFAGFRYFGVEDKIAGTLSLTTNKPYASNYMYYSLLPEKTELSITLDKSLVARQSFKHSIVPISGKRYVAQLNERASYDPFRDVSTYEFYNKYDSFGNLLLYTRSMVDNTQRQRMHYAKKGAWCANVVDTATNANVYWDDSGHEKEIARKNVFEYDGKGNLTKEVTDFGDVNAVTTEHTNFDSFGHPLNITVSANGNSRNSSVGYTQSGRFVNSKTDALGQTRTYAWNEIKGTLSSETFDNKTTTFNYDILGRLCQTVSPTKVQSVSAIQWADQSSPQGAVFYTHEETSGTSPIVTWFDDKGREIRRDFFGLKENKVSVTTEYDDKGRIWRVSEPFFEGHNPTYAQVKQYDKFGRDSVIITPLDTATYSYYYSETTVKSAAGEKTTYVNNLGKVEEINTNGKIVSYEYHPTGLLKSVNADGGQKITMEYDLQGNRTRLIDPDAGIVASEYDGFGRVRWSEQRKNTNDTITSRTEYCYNETTGLLDTVAIRSEKAGTALITTYNYDEKFRTKKIDITNQNSQTFTYDEFGRVVEVLETVGPDRTFTTQTRYDAFGRVAKQTYPSGYFVVSGYDRYGYLTKVTDKNGKAVWEASEANARGQLTRTKQGGRELTFGYNTKGQPTSIVSAGIIDMAYGFNGKGNIEWRADNLTSQREVFVHDDLNRLTNWDIYQSNINVKANAVAYDEALGNIKSKSDIGYTMRYGENGHPPHALTSIEGNPETIPDVGQSISYTPFRKFQTITEGDYSHTLTYGVDRQRRKGIFKHNNQTTLTRYYLGDYEEEVKPDGNTRKIHYISGGNGLSAIFVQNNGADSLYCCYTDYQGNLLAVTNDADTVVHRLAYNPWGARRNPYDWTRPDTRPNHLFARGYTMHEHLDGFGLINMNGRIYDPLVARFLSPDPFIQAPDNWVNFNRYGYCMNNPLIYTDPSGEFFWAALPLAVKIGIGIGAAIGGYTGYKIGEANGARGLGMTGYVLGGAAIGGFSGYLGGTIAAGGGFMANTSAIMVSSSFNSGGMTALSGGQMAPNVSFGIASFNFGTGEWGYLGKKGNSFMENLGYGLGAFANLSDIWSAAYGNPTGELELQTDGHSQTYDPETGKTFSWGAMREDGRRFTHDYVDEFDFVGTKKPTGELIPIGFKKLRAVTDYTNSEDPSWSYRTVGISGVNKSTYYNYISQLPKEGQFYRMASFVPIKGMHCTIAASRALLRSGVFNLPIFRMPWTLDLQMRIRDYTYLSHLTQ